MSALTPVVWATCQELPDGDPDDHLALPAMADAGLDVRYQVWDDPAADWSAPTVIRSTWDYVPRREQYLAWAGGVRQLFNPAGVVAWNTDKTYLDELADDGVPVVASTTLHPAEMGTVAAVVSSALAESATVVVKPTVSGGSLNTARHGTADEATSHALSLLEAGRAVLVQPYLDAVDTAGETGVVVIDGQPSHAFRKGQILHAGAGLQEGLYAEEDIRAVTASDAQLRLARQVTGWLARRFPEHAPLLYARVDTVPGPDGTPLLLEVELTEPSLWLSTDPGSGAGLAAALLRRLRTLQQ